MRRRDDQSPADGDRLSPREEWRPIARFLNAAEAGYFAYELSLASEHPVDLRAEDDYDALSGRWLTRFLLYVPASRADELASVLQNLVERSSDEDFFDSRPLPIRETPEPHEGSSRPVPWVQDGFHSAEFDDGRPSYWVPVVLTLAAGTMVFWGLRKFHDIARPKPAQPPAEAARNDLWDSLQSPPGRVWVEFDRRGRRVRELEFAADGSSGELREDLDGDATFERRVQFQRPVAP